MTVSSAGMGRNWKPSKTDDEYNAEMIRESYDDFVTVAEATGKSVTDLKVAVATRKTTEGFPS
jgi:hypothetical protein